MASTSPRERALELLGYCLRGEPWPHALLPGAEDTEGADALVGIVAEGLADRFEPKLVDTYAELFTEWVAPLLGGITAPKLLARYQRVRQPRRFTGAEDSIATVFVLSRVTLGADVAVTSVLLDAAKRRFPKARVMLAGSRKAWELFANDPRIGHAGISAVRSGSLRERLANLPELTRLLSQEGSLVIDPDTRLSQLGLLPLCPEERYFFFESRAYGRDGEDALPVLAARWAEATFGVEGAAPYIAPATGPALSERPLITVSLGVGENPAKRITDPFEAQWLACLAERGATLLIDKGAGGDEAARVERALAAAQLPRARVFEGSFAHFASVISRSNLYAGYDSAGQHVAAACGVPLVSIFAGFAAPRMFARWRPTGAGRIAVVRVEDPNPAAVLEQARHALDTLR